MKNYTLKLSENENFRIYSILIISCNATEKRRKVMYFLSEVILILYC